MQTAARRLGFSPARLSRLDEFIQRRYLDSGRFPGAVTMIARRGEMAHVSVQGLADVERATPLCEDAIFRIYSMTKPITSVAFMMLAEEGRVALEDPVAAYIPAWKDLGVFVAGLPGAFLTRRPERPMQIIDLLRHTSGLTYGFQSRTNVDAAYRKAGVGEMTTKMPLAEMITALAAMPLEFSPGEAWNYSVSTDVLGYLVEVISGRPFADFVRERITEPLAMADTAFFVPPQKADRLVACYTRGEDGRLKLQDDPKASAYLAPPTFYSGGGGMVSTGADYMAFANMLRAGGRAGKERLLSRKTLALMTANHLPGGGDLTQLSRSLFSESIYAGVGFGLGFAVLTDPAKAMLPSSAGEFYWGGAASTAFWVDPAEDLAVVFLTQLIPSTTYPIRRELRTLIYAAMDD
ncbi:MAG TPA: serine hydrolase domain-containing protein [Caulobacteraceae bacterium]|nr:serine hydrolase domain-containing protein [Caulobacteraceae bacterium]